MQQHHGGAGFDGPGSRPILGRESGPASAAKKSPTSSELPSPTYSGRERPVYGWTPEHPEHPPSRQPYPASGSTSQYLPPPRQQPSLPPPRPHSHTQRPSSQSQGSPPFPSSTITGSKGSGNSQPPPPPLSASSSTPTTSSSTANTVIKRVGGKANVSSACGPCKRAHLACDVARPCKRCVNMGKEDQCEDVPHKKRGRPKVNKAPAEPYQRPRIAPSDDGPTGKWKGPSGGYEAGYFTMTTSPQQVSGGSGLPARLPSPPRTSSLSSVVRSNHSASSSMSPYSSSAPATVTLRPSSQPPDDTLFTLFCSTELKILRATPLCHALTGFHPHEFVNLSFLDWVAPADRQAVDIERARLVSAPHLKQGQLQSSRETHTAVVNQKESELLSPAAGMREPYPHQNVHIRRTDNGYSLFNVRFHLGGGLGGNLWQPETLVNIYLVVSCLLISSNDLPPDSTRRAALLPPTPVTPLPPPPPHSLPSFSSITGSTDPSRDRDRERDRGRDYNYRPGGSGSASGTGGPPPPFNHGPPPTGLHGGAPPGYRFRPGTANAHNSTYPGGPGPRRSPTPPYARPYTSYAAPGYGYERDPRERDPREEPRDLEMRDARDLRDPRNSREVQDEHERMRDQHERMRTLDLERGRDRGPSRDDDWRRSAPPGAHPHLHFAQRSPTEPPTRHATYPPPPGALVHPHPQGTHQPHSSPHQHQPPHSHQPPPPQGAFRSWEL